ncbi:MAG: BtpA family membrane complex biogenesis protein [Armatimonadetes bacterium 13_1_40CM_64_14]|nr:MAG: BtpA family membrane complex biogenesis protein [Armatimonadetes bacterium 13_1_40CM_64_14]
MMAHGVSRPKDNALTAIFGRSRGVVIGVIHSKPLPGSPSFTGESLDEIYAFAVEEGRQYADAGVDGLILENHGDIPFATPDEIGVETAATMAVMADRLRKTVGLPLGINVLANGAIPAVAVAQASGAGFVRVNQWANAYVANEGIIQGPAGRAARYRSWVRANQIKIFADVHVKHGAHAIVADRSITELTRDLEFFDADVVIVTGQRTGDPPSIDELREVREATPLPLVIGSGMTENDVERLLGIADGVIIGSALKRDGVWWNAVDPQRASRFVARVRSL